MEKFNYLIIGGGIAGTTAAETIRRLDASASIGIVSDEPYRLYSRIMLSKPNFFLGRIPFDQIWLKKESWYQEQNIKLVAGKSAIRLDPAGKTVVLEGDGELGYDKLLLTLGGCARRWGLPGADKKGIYYLRTLDEAKDIIDAVKREQDAGVKSTGAIAIGGGFVSFEMCDMLRMAGINVTLLLRESYFWEPVLDEKSGRMIEAALEKGGVKILRKAEVAKILGDGTMQGAVLGDGTEIKCGMIVVGIGVYCPFAWVEGAGVKVNRGIVADEFLRTSVPDVWTAGDSAEFNDLVLGEQIQLGNWVNAQMQGRVAGENMVTSQKSPGVAEKPFRLVSFYTTQGFGITIAFVGDVRPMADRSIILRGSPEAGSYARIISKDGKVIGATLINRTQELGIFSKLIENNFRTAGHEAELADPAFDIKKLL